MIEITKEIPSKRRRGRRSIEETNKIRAGLGLAVVPRVERASTSILPREKQNKNREVLATLLSKKGNEVVNKILAKASNDDDPDQMACLKILVDRMIPVSYFEKDKNNSKGVTINITGVGQTVSSYVEEDIQIIDMEDTDA